MLYLNAMVQLFSLACSALKYTYTFLIQFCFFGGAHMLLNIGVSVHQLSMGDKHSDIIITESGA